MAGLRRLDLEALSWAQMSRATLALPVLLGTLALPAPARAAEARCWFENGVVIVSARVAGVIGDFILDTAAPQTILAETQAQTFGYEDNAVTGAVEVAGVATAPVTVAVQDIDLRTGLLPTPIAGVVGADALKPYVVDLSFTPCRILISQPRRAPRFPRGTILPITWIAKVPTAPAAAADGPHAIRGDFALATGSDTAVRLSDAYAAVPAAKTPKESYPYGVDRPALRALTFAGVLAQNLPAGLIKEPDAAIGGEIGAPLLSAWRVRFDFPGNRLVLVPNEKGPGASPRP